MQDFNNINIDVDIARRAFFKTLKKGTKNIANLTKNYFEQWWKPEYQDSIGLVTLYKFMNLSDEQVEELKSNPILYPRGVYDHGCFENLLQALENGEGQKNHVRNAKEQINAYLKQERGEDISDYIIKYAESSASCFAKKDMNISIFCTPCKEVDNEFFSNWRYRVKIKVPVNKAYRVGNIDKNGNFVGMFDGELEWTLLAPNGVKIIEIYDRKEKLNIFNH